MAAALSCLDVSAKQGGSPLNLQMPQGPAVQVSCLWHASWVFRHPLTAYHHLTRDGTDGTGSRAHCRIMVAVTHL